MSLTAKVIALSFLTSCVEPIEFIQRPAGQGLGATLRVDDVSQRRRLKPGEESRKVHLPYIFSCHKQLFYL